MGYDFKIEYKKGKENTTTDALSKKNEEATTLALISFTTSLWLEDLKESYKESDEIKSIIATIIESGKVIRIILCNMVYCLGKERW